VHDPLVVAFEIRRPWPRLSTLPPADGKRWSFLLRHEHHQPYCGDHVCTGNPFPWWKPRSWSKFSHVAGRELYWPALITVWHREPGGRDSGEVCKHTRRVFDESTRTWKHRKVSRWKIHVHHWRIQVHLAQEFRRWALTRCSWCGGRSRSSDPVNVSHQWDGPRGRWWRGEPGLFHHDCSSVQHAHAKCYCADPLLSHDGHGTCQVCGGHRAWRQEPDEADRLLASLPKGSRITPDIRPAVEAAWAERRARREAASA
jgi:hypothetical protein